MLDSIKTNGVRDDILKVLMLSSIDIAKTTFDFKCVLGPPSKLYLDDLVERCDSCILQL